jgi:hypothetical protein
MNTQPHEYHYLQFVKFKDLNFWDYKSYFRPEGTKHLYETIVLREVLKHRKEFITIDDKQEYKRCRVQLHAKGIVLRDMVKGAAIKTKKQQVCRTEDFLVAEIDAKFGGYGIVPSELHDAIVSSHYFLFEVNQERLHTDFFRLYLATNDFGNQVVATGSTNYAAIRPHHVLGYHVPLPPLDVQERLVSAYNARVREAERCEQEAAATEHGIERYILDMLGIEITQTERKKGLQFVRFKDLEQWGVEKVLEKRFISAMRYQAVTLLDNPHLYYEAFRGKSPQYDSSSQSMILNQKCNRWNMIEIHHAKPVRHSWLSSIEKKFFTRSDDILINSTGEGTIGRSSVIEQELAGLLYDSHLLLVRLNSSYILPHYFVEIFNSQYGQKQVEILKSAVTTKQTELGVDNLKKIPIPLPPLDVQAEIVQTVSSMKSRIKELRAKAETLRRKAKEAFEKELFA